jgi:predicted AAA+ superfamily ATPase
MLVKSDIQKIAEAQFEIISSADTGYIREIFPVITPATKHALILTGIRRCGKSTLMYQLINEKYNDVFFLNFDDPRLYGFENNDFPRLDEVIRESGKKILFFDELQGIQGWERYVRQKLDENYRILITGSNAFLMSEELGTKLTGRYLSKELFPFSYSEFTRYKSLKADEDSMSLYMQIGGFPEYLKNENPEILATLFDDIIIRDIVARYGIRDIKTLKRLALYLISNTGKPVTGSKLKHSVGISATSTIMEYFSHLESVYLFYFVPRFSFSIKSQMINPRKVYSADVGLITVNSASFSDDRGRKLENLIFNYLRQYTKDIYYFLDKNECDFIITPRGKKPLAIQVCHTLDRDNIERELNGLYSALRVLKINQGIIVTFDQTDRFTSKKMTADVVPAYKFLKTPFRP